MKYDITDFMREFPDDDACLEYVFRSRFPGLRGYSRIKGRKAYADSKGRPVT